MADDNRKCEGEERIAVNLYSIALENKRIFRSTVNIEAVSDETGRVFSWTNAKSVLANGDNRAVIRKLIVDSNIAATDYAYDGASLLFTLQKLNIEKVYSLSDLQACISESAYDALGRFKDNIRVNIRPDSGLPSFEQISAACHDAESLPLLINYLEVVTSHSAISSGGYKQFKDILVCSETDAALNKEDRFASLWSSIYPAVHKSCRAVVGGKNNNEPVLVAEIDSRLVRIAHEKLLSELACILLGNGTDGPDWRDMSVLRKFEEFITGLHCTMRAQGRNTNPNREFGTRSYRILGLDWRAAEQPSYRRKYARCRFPAWPAVVYQGGKEPCPLEYFRIAPYQRIPKFKLELVSSVPQAPSPSERYNQIVCHFKRLGLSGNETMKAFGIKIMNDPQQKIPWIAGARGSATEITFGKGEKVPLTDQKRDWTGELCAFSEGGIVSHLLCLVVPSHRTNMTYVRDAFKELTDNYEKKGMKVANKDLRVCPEEYLRLPYDWVNHQFGLVSGYDRPLVMLLSERNGPPLLHEYLKLKEQQYDMPSQHILIDTVCRDMPSGMDPSLLNSLALKTNIKAGGLNYTSSPDKEGESKKSWLDSADEKTFMIGLDVGHPAVQNRDGRTPSVVGMAANAAENVYQFTGDMAFTEGMKEEIDSEILERFANWSLVRFMEYRGPPSRVIIFRDAVSDGQEKEAVREGEAIERAVTQVLQEQGCRSRVKFTLILVKKRHNTRFFRSGASTAPENCRVDTSVSQLVATYGKRELFIQAHHAIQGTARVPSFIILRDDEERTDDEMISLITTCCNLHQITNSPTSSPTPALVAHELADRGASLFKAYRHDNSGVVEVGWDELTNLLEYRHKHRLSHIRYV